MPIDVKFYIQDALCKLPSDIFTCHVIADLYLNHENIHLHTDDAQVAAQLSQNLWQHPQGRFLPHILLPDPQPNSRIISIGYDTLYPSQCHCFLNITADKITTENTQLDFKLLIEIVFNDITIKKLLRQRYLDYRNQKHNVSTINMPPV